LGCTLLLAVFVPWLKERRIRKHLKEEGPGYYPAYLFLRCGMSTVGLIGAAATLASFRAKLEATTKSTNTNIEIVFDSPSLEIFGFTILIAVPVAIAMLVGPSHGRNKLLQAKNETNAQVLSKLTPQQLAAWAVESKADLIGTSANTEALQKFSSHFEDKGPRNDCERVVDLGRSAPAGHTQQLLPPRAGRAPRSSGVRALLAQLSMICDDGASITLKWDARRRTGNEPVRCEPESAKLKASLVIRSRGLPSAQAKRSRNVTCEERGMRGTCWRTI
jgi:hypothetical protein